MESKGNLRRDLLPMKTMLPIMNPRFTARVSRPINIQAKLNIVMDSVTISTHILTSSANPEPKAHQELMVGVVDMAAIRE